MKQQNNDIYQVYRQDIDGKILLMQSSVEDKINFPKIAKTLGYFIFKNGKDITKKYQK